MFTKAQKHLLKEMLIHLYKQEPDAIKWPVYFTPFYSSSIEEIGAMVKEIHRMPIIPWPDQDCIIVADSPLHALINNQGDVLMGIVRQRKLSNRLNSVPKDSHVSAVESIKVVGAAKLKDANNVHVWSDDVTMMRVGGDIIQIPPEIGIERALNEVRQTVSLSTEQEDHFVNWLKNTAPYGLDDYWVARRSATQNRDEPGYASDVFAALVNIIVPCNYVVKSKFTEGFGTKPMRRETKDKPILTMIPFERIYQQTKEPGEGGPKSPHFRRGHIRHLWKESGVDRFDLPRKALDRLKLVAQRQIRRVYVSPSWVGTRFFTDEDCEYEVMVEWELPNIRPDFN